MVCINNVINLNFKRKLRTSEEADFSTVLKSGKAKVGNTGKSILIVPTASLPQEMNTGVGNFLDKKAQEFVDFAKLYWGINEIQTLPDGVYRFKNGNSYFPYSGSALDFGTHIINPVLLTTKEYANILSSEDIEKILLNKKSINNKNVLINFENVLNKGSKTDEILRKAYDNLLKSDTNEKRMLLDDIQNFSENNKEILDVKGIFEGISVKFKTREFYKWPMVYRYLYDINRVSTEERENIINEIKQSEYSKEIDFYKFKQYLAEEHFKKAKTKLNQKSIKLSGDMLLGFSIDEVWANPKAFYEGKSVGWGLPALNFDAPEAEILFRKKIKRFIEHYDGIRVDAAWKYISQDIIDRKTKQLIDNKQHGEKILEIIEDEVLRVKGKDYDLENLMYEFVADTKFFNIFDGSNLKKSVAKRTHICTSYDLGSDWGTSVAYKERGWRDGGYVLGTTNHDSKPLKVEFAEKIKCKKQISTLSKIFKISQEKLNNFNVFVQAKFAEPMRSKHNMFFFTEVLNLSERYKDNANSALDYRLKIPENYQEHYFKSLEKGMGFNIMDALDKAFVAEGLDKTEPDLYKKIVKYKKILQSSEKNSKPYKIFVGVVSGILLALASVLIYKKRVGNTDSNVQILNRHQDMI